MKERKEKKRKKKETTEYDNYRMVMQPYFFVDIILYVRLSCIVSSTS